MVVRGVFRVVVRRELVDRVDPELPEPDPEFELPEPLPRLPVPFVAGGRDGAGSRVSVVVPTTTVLVSWEPSALSSSSPLLPLVSAKMPAPTRATTARAADTARAMVPPFFRAGGCCTKTGTGGVWWERYRGGFGPGWAGNPSVSGFLSLAKGLLRPQPSLFSLLIFVTVV